MQVQRGSIIHDLKDYRYMSSSLVLSDVGMDLRVMGAPAYYPSDRIRQKLVRM